MSLTTPEKIRKLQTCFLRQSEGTIRLPIPSAVRQGLSRRYPDVCIYAVQNQCWSRRCRCPDLERIEEYGRD